MKKPILSGLLLFLIVAILSLTGNAQSSQKARVLTVSRGVIGALKARDMNRLSGFVHPVKGVRFSPYGSISRKDLVFTPGQVKELLKDKTVYIWGSYDESERQIKNTFAGYYAKFVYDRDFAKPDLINYNLKQNNGIMINNIAKMYPKGVEVEYFIDGTDDRMYASLRLIYEQLRGKWFLVGVVRDTPGI